SIGDTDISDSTNKVKYVASTRTISSLSGSWYLYLVIPDSFEPEPPVKEPIQVFAKDKELVTMEYFLEHGGGDATDYVTYSSDAFETLATHTYEIDEYTQDEVDAMFSETPEELEELSKIINDQIKSKFKLWSSLKISDEIAQAIIDSNAYADGLIGSISSISLEVVQSLPAQGASNIIYILQLSDKNTLNVFSNGSWVEVGNLDVDFSDYYNKTTIDEKLDLKADKDSVLTPDDVKQDLSDPNGTDVLSTFGVNKTINSMKESQQGLVQATMSFAGSSITALETKVVNKIFNIGTIVLVTLNTSISQMGWYTGEFGNVRGFRNAKDNGWTAGTKLLCTVKKLTDGDDIVYFDVIDSIATVETAAKKSIVHQSVATGSSITLDNDCVALLVDWWNSEIKTTSLVSIIPKRDMPKWYLGTSDREYISISGNTFTSHCSTGIYIHVVEIF
ncbi:MAG: hypothetical protein KBT27_14970, partial [Prevotellaceae bacterium]|nr:hypothetical protein [Candidatus Faecinaster equi]